MDEAGRFVLGELLGQGGMGRVVRAFDRALDRDVALKLMPLAGRDQSQLERFRREGEAAARLDHPGIVRVHSAGVLGSDAYLAYELVEGARPLDEASREVDLAQRVAWVLEAAQALAHAHERGVVHRDVKPGNVLVDAQGRVRVTDFGLARATGFTPLTRTGALLGTPCWLAPEAFQGHTAGPSVDVWALGVLLYEALTGLLPFRGVTLPELWQQVTVQTPVPPRQLDPHLPAALEAVCLRALAKRPEDRPPDAGAFAALLEAGLSGEHVGAGPRGRRTRRLLVVGAVPLALLGAGLGARGPRAPAAQPAAGAEGAQGALARPASRAPPAPARVTWHVPAGHTVRARLAYTCARLEDGVRNPLHDQDVTVHHEERVVRVDPQEIELELRLVRIQALLAQSGWTRFAIDTTDEQLAQVYPGVPQLLGLTTRLVIEREAGRVRCGQHEEGRIDQLLAVTDEPAKSMLSIVLDAARAQTLARRLGLLWCLDAEGGQGPAGAGRWERERELTAFTGLGLVVPVQFQWADGEAVGRGAGARTVRSEQAEQQGTSGVRLLLSTRWAGGRVAASRGELELREVARGRGPTQIDHRLEYALEE